MEQLNAVNDSLDELSRALIAQPQADRYYHVNMIVQRIGSGLTATSRVVLPLTASLARTPKLEPGDPPMPTPKSVDDARVELQAKIGEIRDELDNLAGG
jgi:hypothetical protein